MTLRIGTTTVVNSDRSVTLGAATPAAPVTGLTRFNGRFEIYDGTAWVPVLQYIPPDIPNLWAWGNNRYGALGINNTIARSSPVSAMLGLGSDWTRVGGNYSGMALRANGTLWMAGISGNGRLGINTTGNQSSPVSVVGGFTDWTWISSLSGSGDSRGSSGVRANGTAWTWGQNQYGALGINTTGDRSSPVSVVGGFTDWTQVVNAGGGLALRANGTIWGWGTNGNGRIGTNDTVTRSSPVSVVGGFTDWIQIAGNYANSAALRANGTAWTWGQNNGGALGVNDNNVFTSRSSPVSVVGGFTDWQQISVGSNMMIGVRANGTAWSWGAGTYGQLGINVRPQIGVVADRSSPVSVVGGITDWIQVNATQNSSVFALRAI